MLNHFFPFFFRSSLGHDFIILELDVAGSLGSGASVV